MQRVNTSNLMKLEQQILKLLQIKHPLKKAPIYFYVEFPHHINMFLCFNFLGCSVFVFKNLFIPQPSRAVGVLSFDGWVGGGKKFV